MPDPLASPPKHRHIAWLWFAYTGFIVIDPCFEPSIFLWTVTLLAIVIFAFIFAAYKRCDEDESSPRRYWLIVATFILGLVVFPFNGGASTFFIYTAAFLPFVIASTRRVLLLFVAEFLVIIAETLLLHRTISIPHTHATFGANWPNTFIAIFLILIIGGANIFFAEQKRFNLAQLQAERDLRAAQEENNALAAVAERERIARDLHDVLGHTLSVIVLKAELAGRLVASDPARATAEIADVERTARTALSEVREAIGGYRTRGLAAEIEAARRTLDLAGVTLTVDAENQPAANLTPQEETVLALALREAVTNIVRHARATTCTLRFVTEDRERRLVVEDNGSSPTPPREGNGLRGMRQRIESIGGRLQLQHGCADKEHGTRLLITLPQPGAAL
ncbi:sensor histidine kinase [Granulicella sp. 5B5]|uniref:sensor histidine kinase n=1 Tax=Granulicella sp. 5B5 TaxID=1617967 RepID=UPI0015F3E504|nr:sensor histidine kinase [Granulicella sp. 5B5]